VVNVVAMPLAHNHLPVGTVRIRTRHKRGGERRAFIKIAEPNTWVLRARHVWESVNGPILPRMGIHHRDEDKLNDELSNLELVTKRDHLAEHRPAFRDKSIAALVRARKSMRWSTKSTTKRTGRHPAGCTCEKHATTST
jgi:hypothetical protein